MSDLVANERAMTAPADASLAAPLARAEAVLSLLREDVEAAGKATRYVRLGANVATLSLLFAEAPGVISYLRELVYRWPTYAHSWQTDHQSQLLVVGVTAAVLGGQGVATLAAAAYRRLRAEHLRRRLSMFTPEQQVAALQPLENARLQDTREIAGPLLRLARAESAAVTPAEPPSLGS